MITFKDFLLESSKTIDTFLLNNVFKHNPDSFNEFKKTNKNEYNEVTKFLQPYINCLDLFVLTSRGKQFIKIINLKEHEHFRYDKHAILDRVYDTLELIQSLPKSTITVLAKFLHITSLSSSIISISDYDLSKLSTVDTDILQYISSLKDIMGHCNLTVDGPTLKFEVQITNEIKIILSYMYDNGMGIVSTIDFDKLNKIIESTDELEIIEAFNKELKSSGVLKKRAKTPKMDDDTHKDSLHLYVRDQLKFIKYGVLGKTVNISDETIDKQFDVSLKINDNPIQLILPYIPVSNTIFKHDKYDLFTLVNSSINHNIKFPRFFVDVYDRYGDKVNNEPIDLLAILCYGDYTIPTLDNLDRLTGNVEGYFVKIDKRLVYNGTHKLARTHDPLFLQTIPIVPLVYMCIEKDVHGNYIVTNRQSTISRSFNDCDTFIANKKDVKPYVFVKL